MPSAAIVYLLCLLVSAACALLLVRTYLRQPTPLLLWSAICFVLLAINNLLVVSDIVLFPEMDLRPWRIFASLGAVSVLLYGFIWELD
jgi:hypothetical protein